MLHYCARELKLFGLSLLPDWREANKLPVALDGALVPSPQVVTQFRLALPPKGPGLRTVAQQNVLVLKGKERVRRVIVARVDIDPPVPIAAEFRLELGAPPRQKASRTFP
jgi:hypothetical protein